MEGHYVTWPLYGLSYEMGLGVPNRMALNAGSTSFPVYGTETNFGGLVPQFLSSVNSYGDSTLAVPIASGPFSVSCWCMTNTTSSSSGGGGLRNIIGTENAAGGSNQFIIRYNPSTGHFECYVLGGGNSLVAGAGTVATFTAYQLLMTVSATTQTFYINGVSQGSIAPANTVASRVLSIGNDDGNDGRNRQWSGWISDVSIWLRELTATEAWQLYDPATRWNRYWVPSTRTYSFVTAAASAFNPAWARGSNQLLSGGFAS
jgi:hypothetical protein